MADLNVPKGITVQKGNKMKLVELRVQPCNEFIYIVYESHDGTKLTGARTTFEIGPNNGRAFDVNNNQIDINLKYDDVNLNSLVNLNAVLNMIKNNYEPVPED